MADNIALADAIRNSIRQYKQLSEFADALEGLGSIEQALVEVKAEHAKVSGFVLDVKGELNSLKVQVNQTIAAKAEAEQTAIETIKQATNIAKEVADEYRKIAHQEAGEIVAKAKAKYKDLEDKGAVLMQEAQGKAAAAVEEVEKANQTLIEKRAELEAIQAEIQALKASASKLFGA